MALLADLTTRHPGQSPMKTWSQYDEANWGFAFWVHTLGRGVLSPGNPFLAFCCKHFALCFGLSRVQYLMKISSRHHWLNFFATSEEKIENFTFPEAQWRYQSWVALLAPLQISEANPFSWHSHLQWSHCDRMVRSFTICLFILYRRGHYVRQTGSVKPLYDLSQALVKRISGKNASLACE